jgi:hypothetical protein
MTLVYLDTSNIHLLTTLRRKDNARFTSFLERWRGLSCTLALSNVHLFELRRYGDASARDERYQLLEDLCPIRFQSESMDGVEILRALSKHRDTLGLDYPADQLVEAFPKFLHTPTEVSQIRELEHTVLALAFEAFYDASKTGAAAHSREEGTKYERHRISQIGDAKPAPEHRAMFLEEWEKQQPSSSELENLRELVPPEVLNEMFDAFRDLGLRFLDRAEEVGSANAYAEALGLDLSDPSIARSFTDQASQQYAFRFSVREAAQTLGVQCESGFEMATELVRLEDCPGTWLRHAVEIQIRKATAKDEPSNLFDLNHLGHLPYVNLLFTDKRIAEFARQVLSSSNLPASLRHVKKPLAVSNSIEALESALSSGSNS